MYYLKNIILKALFIFVFQVINLNLSAQNILPDSIEKKMTWYSLQKPQQILFAHFDKTIYAQNENVWFTAYLLNRKNTDNPQVLSISLVNDLSKSVVLEQKFLMTDGISFGNVFLPDSIQAGNYTFMLYTNQLYGGKPADVFIQPITVAVTNELTFKASLNLDTIETNPAGRKALLSAVTKDGKPLVGAIIKYTLGNIKKTAKTDNAGKYLITIPLSQINADNNVLEANVKYNNDVQNVKLIIPFNNKKISVKFYPEGGSLIHEINGTVGWEIKTREGAPMKAKGILYKNDMPVDTIETDSYGMGRFKLTPLKSSKYAVKLMASDFRDSIFKLPEILPKSSAISIPNSLANDTLKIKLTSKYLENVTILVHNYRQIFYAFPVKTNAAGKIALINLKILPKGLATITILDSAKRPCAERLFFAHYNKRSLIDVQTDKSQYAKREKVKLTLKFKTIDTGLVSVACVQSNRMQIKNSYDIESFVYLKHELEALPLKVKYMGNNQEDKAYLENILLIKGWRRYTWQEMLQTTEKDTVSNQSSLVLSGKVTHLDQRLRKPARFFAMTDSATTSVKSDQLGNFTLDNNVIITDENKKVHFWAMDRNRNEYEIRVNDPYSKINREIAASLKSQSNSPHVNNSDPLVLKGFQHTIALKEVKIKGVKDNSLLNSFSAEKIMPTENECGDYICMFGIFNCPNHKGFANNTIPIEGHYYIIRGRETRYSGCIISLPKNKKVDSLNTIPGIKYSKEFYGSDYSVVSPSQPEYYSTIFWKHLIPVNSSVETVLNFYTSDITGAFKVIVQGITRKDVVYQEKEFTVK